MGSAVFTDPLAHSRAPFRFATTRRSYRSRRRLVFVRRWFVPSGARSDGPRGPSGTGGESLDRPPRRAPLERLLRHPSSSNRAPPGLGPPDFVRSDRDPRRPGSGPCGSGAFHPVERSAGAARSPRPRAQSFPYERDRGTPLESCDSAPSRPGPVMGLPRRLGFDPAVQTPTGFPV